jgi:DNA-binding XRE family transcriptional regulator
MMQRRLSRSGKSGRPTDVGARALSKFFRVARTALGRSQSEIAAALSVSAKAVQSYEQGWRRVPARVVSQMLMLLALQRGMEKRSLRCWMVNSCPPEKRKLCPSYTITGGRFCWFVAGKMCGPRRGSSAGDVSVCMKCPVVKELVRLSVGRR